MVVLRYFEYFNLELPLINQLKAQIEQLHHSIREQSAVISEQRASAELGKMAKQVSHDIGLPLTALVMAADETSALPERQRLMIRSAVGRIHDISNQLSEKGKQSEACGDEVGANSVHSDPQRVSSQLISGLIEILVTDSHYVQCPLQMLHARHGRDSVSPN